MKDFYNLFWGVFSLFQQRPYFDIYIFIRNRWFSNNRTIHLNFAIFSRIF